MMGGIAMARRRTGPDADAERPPPPPAKPRQSRGRDDDTHCRIHTIPLDDAGYCAVAQAWWVPRFACPGCRGWLWDNGYCERCTPQTSTFPGDYFEQRWDADAGREYGHFVRVSRGPTPAPTREQVDAFVAELKALVGAPPMRQPGEEPVDDVVPF